jgi:hypothetical protein
LQPSGRDPVRDQPLLDFSAGKCHKT